MFGVGGNVNSDDLALHTTVQPPRQWSFLSLCCQTGYAEFAKRFSAAPCCREIIAPFHSVHGAVASQFAQSFFAYHSRASWNSWCDQRSALAETKPDE